MTMKSWLSPLSALFVAMTTVAAVAETPYPTPTPDGRSTILRDGGRPCPTGYVGVGNKCEALHHDTPVAYPNIKGAP